MKFFCSKKTVRWYWFDGRVDDLKIWNSEFLSQDVSCRRPAQFHVRGKSGFLCYGHAMMLGERRVRPAFWKELETVDEFNARILDSLISSRHTADLLGLTPDETRVVYRHQRSWP